MKIIKCFAIIILLSNAAIAGTVSINLGWDHVTLDANGNPLTDLSGYTVFQSTHDFNVGGVWISTAAALTDTSIGKANVSSSTVSYTAIGLADNTQYYFRLTAFDVLGQHSGFNQSSLNADTEVAFRLAISPTQPRNLILR